jgi:hypothetical protein
LFEYDFVFCLEEDSLTNFVNFLRRDASISDHLISTYRKKNPVENLSKLELRSSLPESPLYDLDLPESPL